MSKNTDRHKPHSRQYNQRVPTVLIEAFTAACRSRNLKPAIVTRNLMQGFVDLVAEADAGVSQS